MLSQVGLEHRGGHLPSKLSGGEQQRISIARAMANNPRVLLADEPTGNLDTRTAVGVIDLLGSVVERNSVTMVLVTHAEEVASRAARCIAMRDGAVVDGLVRD